MSFPTVIDDLLREMFALQPQWATEIGNHEHDGAWPDLTDAGQAAWSDWLRAAEARLTALDPAPLSRDEAIDRTILLRELAAMRFSADELREHAWNPMSYVYLFGGALFTMLSRDYAPMPDRLRHVAERLRALPAALGAGRAALAAGTSRPVSRFHGEKAAERMTGVSELADLAIAEAQRTGDPALAEEVNAAAALANAAVADWIAWLRDELVPSATGDFRLGPELYHAKFRNALQTEVTVAELERRALTEYDALRTEMATLARRLWPDWMGDIEPPADDNAAIRAVLDAIAADHPGADELLDYCRAENARIEAFVEESDLLGLADEPLKIIWTPNFARGFGGAMLIPPGPLDRGLDSFFAITPVNPEWPPERQESYLREDNARMLRLLTIHEAVPGHYLQLAYANRSPSTVRAIFSNGVFAEGWAVYITQVMMDVGYGSEDPALMLVHLKFYLRAVTNALMDIRIHTGAMDETEAMSLMVDGGFQEYGEAAAKWDRARLSSTQLCSYFLGSVEMHELEAEARRRAAAAGREFVYRPYLESVLAHGTPSLPVVREILFG